jgi:AcrR family transcriptional regulator
METINPNKEINTKDRILQCSRGLFYQIGYSKICLDHISSEIGISKKTIYKFFPSKKDLFKELILNDLQFVQDSIRTIIKQNKGNFQLILKEIINFLSDQSRSPTDFAIQDIRKNEPVLYSYIQTMRQETIPKIIKEIIEEGIRENAVIPDLNPDLVSAFLLGAISSIIDVDENRFPNIPKNQLKEQLLRIVFFGLLKRT